MQNPCLFPLFSSFPERHAKDGKGFEKYFHYFVPSFAGLSEHLFETSSEIVLQSAVKERSYTVNHGTASNRTNIISYKKHTGGKRGMCKGDLQGDGILTVSEGPAQDAAALRHTHEWQDLVRRVLSGGVSGKSPMVLVLACRPSNRPCFASAQRCNVAIIVTNSFHYGHSSIVTRCRD